MTTLTNTVLLDLDTDYVYETDITTDVLSCNIGPIGRSQDFGQGAPGLARLVLDNSTGKYTPRNTGSALYNTFHPKAGVRVTSDAGILFTGFIRRIFVDPRPDVRRVNIECADWLWVLSRTDISMPLLQNVRSGTLISRALDYAELTEKVANPRFKDDTTGYSLTGGATSVTRETTGLIFEGKASGKVTVSNALDSGVRYTIPSGIAAEDKIQAVAYVRADTSADEGKQIKLRIRDNIGIVANSSPVTLTADYFQPIVLADSYFTGATSFFLDVITSSAQGVFSFRLGALHCVLYENAIPRSIDTGQSTFANVQARRAKALTVIQDAAESELGGLVFVSGNGNVTFHDKHHRWLSTTSQGTIDETMLNVPYEENADDLVGLVELRFNEYEEGIAGSTIFILVPTPRQLQASSTLTLNLDYDAIIKDVITPVATTDYLFNEAADGSGADETANVSIAFEDFGGGAQVVFTNNVARQIYLTFFQVRGTPIRDASDSPQVTYTPAGAPHLASKLSFSYNLTSDRAAVIAWAQYLGDRYVTQRERLPVALVNKTAALAAQIVQRDISDIVTIRNDNSAYSSKINGDYYIDQVKYRLHKGATLIEADWVLTPVDESFWILGTSALDSSTRLGP